jgi:hypothetical protein
VDPPAAPGVLAAGPSGLTLTPGSTGAAVATLFDSTGVPTTVGAITWSTSDAGVATVQPSGAFTAIAPGTALLTATDDAGRTATMLVIVSNTPPAGPAAVQFDRPVANVTLGTPVSVRFAVTSALGVPAAVPAGLSLVATPAGIVDPTPAGTLTPLAAGAALVRASLDGGTTFLAGQLFVLVTKPLVTQDCGDPLDYSVVGGCGLIVGPQTFTTPHLSAGPVRILVARQPRYPICVRGYAKPPALRLQEESPDEVRFEVNGVVAVNAAGRLESVAPGATYLSLFKEGVFCGEYRARVDPDLNSAWNVSCANGDVGLTTVTDWPAVVKTYSPPMAGASGYENPARPGTSSCASNPSDGFSCTGNGKVIGPEVGFSTYLGGVPVTNDWSATCTPKAPCPGPVPSVCALSRNMATCEGGDGLPHPCYDSRVLGPDHLRIGTCDLTRGATNSCGAGWTFTDSISGLCCYMPQPFSCSMTLQGTMNVTNSGGALSGTWEGTLTAPGGSTPESGTVSGTMDATTITLTLTGPSGSGVLSGTVGTGSATLTASDGAGCSESMVVTF